MTTVTRWLLVCLAAMVPAAMASAELKLVFPQNRGAFQTNELINVSILRTGEGELPAGSLTLALEGEKTKMTFVFDLKAGSQSATDHLHLNGWLIKPGTYTLTATMGGQSDTASLDVFSHIRRSTYKTIHWWGPVGEAMKGEGDGGLGINLMFGGVDEWSIREKMDIMGIMAMGGMHQHDGNLDCDWSDPYVYIGSIQRAMDRGLPFRTMPNFVGVHLHDEPGLTWNAHPKLPPGEDGKPPFSPHDIASQRAAYFRAFDKEQPWVTEVDTSNPDHLAAWTHLGDFKLGYMEAFWRASRDAVERIKPGALAVTQTIYGWHYPYDGYYFNIARSMPVVSGHGGYNDYWLMNFNPSFYLECSLPRQWDKPTWYLPTWYSHLTADQLRLEQYMSFITGIQGLAIPPDIKVGRQAEPAVKETNLVAARLGTVFTKPAYTRHDVALLYAKSDGYFHKEVRQTGYLAPVYLATKLIQQPITVVLEEDVLDGTLAAGHKAVIVVGVEYLDPAVVDALADFAKTGLVLVGDEVKVTIPGAVKLGVAVNDFNKVQYTAMQAATKDIPEGEEGNKAKASIRAKLLGWPAWVEGAKPIAEALKTKLATAKIAPTFVSDSPFVAPGRQVRGEIEYIFAVNFAMEQKEEVYVGDPAVAAATITLADDGRPIYDAMTAKDLTKNFAKAGGGVRAKIDFAAGDMKAFARTARPIGGVLVSTPVLNTDLTREQMPVRVELAATLVDTKNQVISGTAPLQIVVTDPAGGVRYDLFRATDRGVCVLDLPLAANDAAGTWTVTVTDLLAGTTGKATFAFTPLTRARLAGATHRAVFFGDDRPNVYRFFRDHRNVTIAIGESDYNEAAAKRLAAALKPYNVTCDIVKAKDVLARELSAEEARTWCGTGVAGKLNPGRNNAPSAVGWDLKNPTVVIGTPEDNVMIAHMARSRVLPYATSATFPGKGKGMVAWNLFALGHDVQSVICIGYDAEGMSQAIGTLFEMAVGLEPLLPLALPKSAVIEMAK